MTGRIRNVPRVDRPFMATDDTGFLKSRLSPQFMV